MNPAEIHVWRVRLDAAEVPPPTAAEEARAARFLVPGSRQQYLKAHGALRAILGRLTASELIFAVTEAGKPYLPGVPSLKFNLSHSGEMALIAVALELEVGVDVERIRPMTDFEAIADRFFPPSEAAGLSATAPAHRHRDFFRRWTRCEAALKAMGVGLYSAGTELVGLWTIEDIDAGPDYAAAVAAPGEDRKITVHDFGDPADGIPRNMVP